MLSTHLYLQFLELHLSSLNFSSTQVFDFFFSPLHTQSPAPSIDLVQLDLLNESFCPQLLSMLNSPLQHLQWVKYWNSPMREHELYNVSLQILSFLNLERSTGGNRGVIALKESRKHTIGIVISNFQSTMAD